jgi:hypothetical protein
MRGTAGRNRDLCTSVKRLLCTIKKCLEKIPEAELVSKTTLLGAQWVFLEGSPCGR